MAAPSSSFSPPMPASFVIGRHSHLDSSSYRSLLRILSVCLPLHPPKPSENPNPRSGGESEGGKSACFEFSEVQEFEKSVSGDGVIGVRPISDENDNHSSDAVRESVDHCEVSEFRKLGVCDGADGVPPIPDNLLSGTVRESLEDGKSDGLKFSEVPKGQNSGSGDGADGVVLIPTENETDMVRESIEDEKSSGFGLTEVSGCHRLGSLKSQDGVSSVSSGELLSQDGESGSSMLPEVEECVNPGFSGLVDVLSLPNESLCSDSVKDGKSVCFKIFEVSDHACSSSGNVDNGVLATELMKDDVRREECSRVHNLEELVDADCRDGDFPEELISGFADELIGLVQGSPIRDKVARHEGGGLCVKACSTVSGSESKDEILVSVQDDGGVIGTAGNIKLSFASNEVHPSLEELQIGESLEDRIMETPNTVDVFVSGENEDWLIKDGRIKTAETSMLSAYPSARVLEESGGPQNGVLDDENMEEGEISDHAEVFDEHCDMEVKEERLNTTFKAPSDGKSFGARDGKDKADQSSVIHDRADGPKCTFSEVEIQRARNLKACEVVDTRNPSFPGEILSYDVFDDAESNEDEEDEHNQEKKKKRGGSMTEKRKAKKKIAKKRKRAEKEREQGVKRLKLQPVLKPKKVLSCKYYLHGKCDKGDQCKFSHDCTPLTKSKACVYFARGECLKDDDCPYDHELSKYPCHSFMSRGSCVRGDECKFSHKVSTGEGSEAPTTSTYSKKADPKFYASKANSTRKTPSAPFSIYQAMKEDLVESCLKIPAQAPEGVRFLSFLKDPWNGNSKQQVMETQKIQNEVREGKKISLGMTQTTDKDPIPNSFPGSTKISNEVSEARKMLNEFLFQDLYI